MAIGIQNMERNDELQRAFNIDIAAIRAALEDFMKNLEQNQEERDKKFDEKLLSFRKDEE